MTRRIIYVQINRTTGKSPAATEQLNAQTPPRPTGVRQRFDQPANIGPRGLSLHVSGADQNSHPSPRFGGDLPTLQDPVGKGLFLLDPGESHGHTSQALLHRPGSVCDAAWSQEEQGIERDSPSLHGRGMKFRGGIDDSPDGPLLQCRSNPLQGQAGGPPSFDGDQPFDKRSAFQAPPGKQSVERGNPQRQSPLLLCGSGPGGSTAKLPQGL
jgi:hypothetical protein